MGNENGSHTNPKNGDSITIGAVTFAILILTMAIFTTLLNTKQLAALDTKTTLLEARLVSQEKISSSLKKQFDSALLVLKNDLVVLKADVASSLQLQNEQHNAGLTMLTNQLRELETVLKADQDGLIRNQNQKITVLKAQLVALKAQVTSLLSQQDEKIVALADEQNLKFSGFEAQLEALSNQVTQIENLKEKEVEPVILSDEPKDTSTEVEPESSTVEPENSTVEPENSTVEPENSAVEPEIDQTESSN